ncbi:unnamed protein product [Amoebophrya sp. A120]|nr:unnamed protein product [Amoebophrya sp. A120]|eukprot:GSA120T00011831001.1
MGGGNKAGLKYTSGYLLAAMKGDEVTADMIKSIFEAGGVEYEMEYINLVVEKMSGKSVSEVLSAGLGNLEACGGGGGGGAAAGGSAGGAAAGGAEEKKEEAPPEEEEEEMEFDLFD